MNWYKSSAGPHLQFRRLRCIRVIPAHGGSMIGDAGGGYMISDPETLIVAQLNSDACAVRRCNSPSGKCEHIAVNTRHSSIGGVGRYHVRSKVILCSVYQLRSAKRQHTR